MSLPVYFVHPPGLSTPAGKSALCGWHLLPDGSLTGPVEPEPSDALVFDDRRTISKEVEALIGSILQAKEAIKAKRVILDFERRPTPTSLSFVKSLSDRCPTAAPEAYCRGTKAEPIFCYCPRLETFEAFSRRITAPKAWLELRPVDDTIFYPISGTAPTEPSAGFFSDVLQCHYKAESTPEGLKLQLYDTRESLLRRTMALCPHLSALIGLQSELEAFEIADSLFSSVDRHSETGMA